MNIKDYVDKELKSYIVGLNILLFLLNFNSWFKIDFSDNDLKIILQVEEIILPILEIVAVSSVVGVFVFIMDSIYSSEVKDIVTLMKAIKKPGMKIFSKINNNKLRDERINNNEAKEQYKSIIDKIPKGKEKYGYENTRWYSIYNKYENEKKILVSQRDYLLCRDLCVATISEGILVLGGMFLGIMPWSYKVFIVLGILYLVTMISAYNKADRFCRNVIAKDISENTKDKESKIIIGK